MLYIVDAANLFVGDDDTSQGEFLALKSLKLPSLNEKTKDHSPGGGIAAMQIGMRMLEALEATFKLEGPNPRTMTKFMPLAPINYTVRANYRDVRNGGPDQALVAVIQGRMSMMETSEFSRDAGVENDYKITEIMRYRMSLGGIEKIRIDVLSGPSGIYIDGQPLYGDMARNLGLL